MEKNWLGIIGRLLAQKKLSILPKETERLKGDGSDRQFYRVSVSAPVRSVIVVLPPQGGEKKVQEAYSSYAIACHLRGKGVPVPRVYGFDHPSGIILFEDVGDQHLSSYLSRWSGVDEKQEAIYQRIIDILLHMQLEGTHGLQSSMCCDAYYYDHKTMVEKEGMYFVRSCVRDLFGIPVDENGLLYEFHQVVDRIEEKLGESGNAFFLHRDFQSRNIMVQEGGEIRIIDFQAARLGPLAYDLASLLIDPYADLPPVMQQRLFSYYCQILDRRRPGAVQTVLDTYPMLALQRNMQILGAFAFLSQRRKKAFFAPFIPLALRGLRARLAEERFDGLVKLKTTVQQMENKIASGSSHA